MKLDLLTFAAVVDDAIMFVSQQYKDNLKSSINEVDKEEPSEPVYNEDEDQLEEGQEEEAGEIAQHTQQLTRFFESQLLQDLIRYYHIQ